MCACDHSSTGAWLRLEMGFGEHWEALGSTGEHWPVVSVQVLTHSIKVQPASVLAEGGKF